MYAALQAGEKILSIYKDVKGLDTVFKSDDSPLTIADTESNKIITQILAEENSSYPVLSEEGPEISFAHRQHWSTFWLIDPLDGTKEFLKGNGEFTVNIALIENKLPVMGVVYVPVQKSIYFATKGEGAFKSELNDLPAAYFQDRSNIPEIIRNSFRIKSNKTSPLKNRPVCVAISRSHREQKSEEFILRLQGEFDRITMLSAGSSLKICLVAEGKADIYPRLAPTMEWDIAAGHAIAAEAGCALLDFSTGKDLRYNKEQLQNPDFIVSAPWLSNIIAKLRL